MPAKSPAVGDLLAARLQALGQRIRTHRESQKLSATLAAEAAGVSRVTLHRIERGEPSVTMGAYLGAIDALGLYERNWKHVDQAQLEPTERALLDQLAAQLGGGRPLV